MNARSSGGLPGVALALLLCSGSLGVDLNQDPAPEEYLLGTGISLPLEERETVFHADDASANFTSFHGVEGAAVDDGKLRFTLAGPRATLGWGNYAGKQPVGEIADMGQQTIVVRLRLRQSADRSKWTARLWRDGSALEARCEAVLEDYGWQELAFKPLKTGGANPDGLELGVEAPEGTRVEVEWLKLVQPTYEGYCRREFVLPEGRVWRAVANVGSANQRHWTGRDQMAARLSINGRPGERQGAKHLYHTAPVDLGPYLKPGRNCVGLYGFRIGYPPFLYFQARIVMASGEVVTVASGTDWKCCPRAEEGWDRPGFDDSAWAAAERGTSPWLTSRDASGRVGIPAYTGRLVMKHPTGKDLFYVDDADAVVEVHVPPGLAERRPTLHYALGRAADDGTCRPVGEDAVAAFTERDGSLVYELNLGRHERGVYALALSLAASDGQVIEARAREPLIVLPRRTRRTIEGSDYREGLDLELEDTVDFTAPNDPHAWFESRMPSPMYGPAAEKVDEPVIVRKAGLTYREVADPRRGSGFSYRIEFAHPGSFYLLELEYPDDAERVVEVVISSKTEGVWTNSQSGVGAETGGRFLPTGRMRKLRWLHVADAGPHSVDVINMASDRKAAARSLAIYRVRGGLPSVGAGAGRSYGIHTERCFFTSGIGMNFGVGMARNPQEARKEEQALRPMRLCRKDLVWMLETGERYVDYLKFAGQNCHVMGCIQYGEYNTPFAPAPPVDDARVVPCMKTVLANLLQTAGIDFYAGVEFSQSNDVRSYANDAQVARGADTVWMVDAEGRQRYGHERVTIVPNWMHPAVRRRYGRLMRELSDTFGHLGHFRGVHALLGPTVGAGYWIPAFGSGSDYDRPLVASFDDLAMERFERETGVELPIAADDPERFAKRASLLATPPLRDRFFEWRCEKVKEFFTEAASTLRQTRPDLRFVNVLAVEDSQFFQHLVRSGKSFRQVMREFAIDPDRLSTVENSCVGRWTLSWRQTGGTLPSQDPFCWLARTRPDVIAAFPPGEQRYVFVRTSWDENMFPGAGHAMKDRRDHDRLVESDWIMNGEKIRALPQPGGYHCREAFVQALITADPNLLVGGFTDLNVNVGHEQALRSVLATYTHLPREKFTPVLETGLESNLAIRQLNRADDSWLYVANPCQWHVRGKLMLTAPGAVIDVPAGQPVATTATARDGRVELPVHLAPFGLAAYRVDAPGLRVSGYATEPMAPEELDRLERIPDRVQKLLADPVARLSLSPADRRWMDRALAAVRGAVDEGRYAQAWSRITHHRFWARWHDFLEKAAAERGDQAGRVGPDAARDAAARLPRRIAYDPEKNCLRVVGFPEEEPATPETILAADRRNGWGKVAYDETTDTYTIDAALWIGDDRTDGTFVQLGDRGHPEVRVVVRGTVWVRPPGESEPRSDGLASAINRLRLGRPDDDHIRPTLAIDCATRGQHGVYVGYRSHDSKTWIHGGSLHVYHGTITAATQDADHAWGVGDYRDEAASPRWGTPGWYAADARLVGATLSWFDGCVTYGAATGRRDRGRPVDAIVPNEPNVIRGTTFEHGGAAVRNGQQYLEDCTFRHLEAAVAEGGSLSAKLVGCTFENNRANWTLGSAQSGGIVLVDCRIGEPREPLAIGKNTIDPRQAVAKGIPVYPACRERRTLPIRVVDSAGEPVPGAFVVVTCDDHPAEVTHGATMTDEHGLTPSDAEAGAIVVTTTQHQATDDPDAPRTSTFTYTIAVGKKGRKPTTVRVDAGRPIARPLEIVLP